jgi:hypothetical protein
VYIDLYTFLDVLRSHVKEPVSVSEQGGTGLIRMHIMVIKTEGVQVRILALGPNEPQHQKITIRIS